MDKIICVGKNYLAHAKELGDQVPEKPVLFLKPPSVAIIADHSGQTLEVVLPQGKGAVHYECEILLRLDHSGSIQSVSLGLDMTLRDIQAELKKKGHPWELGKVFKNSAVLGPWIPVAEFKNYLDEEFTFSLDGVIRQKGQGKEMRFSPETCIAYVKEYFPISNGDILFTGTPEGVGPVTPGQKGEIRWGNRLFYKILFKES